MKIVAILLALVSLGLGYGLYQRNTGATEEAEAAMKQFQSLSNQVAELRTKLALAQGTSVNTQSNLQSTLDRRTLELLVTSNRVVQTQLLLRSAQQDAQDARTDLQTKAAAIATLETQRDELGRRLEVIPPLQQELAGAKAKLAQTLSERDELARSLDQVRFEKTELERKLEDPACLRLQVKKAEDAAELRKRAAGAATPIDVTDARVRLELQPDGTVRALTPAKTPKKK